MNNIFVKESDVNYLWSGFEKKLESLSALRSSSRVCAEAFDVSGLCTQGDTLAAMSLVQVNSVLDESKPRGTMLFFWGLFLSFPLCFFIVVAFPFLSFKIFTLIH